MMDPMPEIKLSGNLERIVLGVLTDRAGYRVTVDDLIAALYGARADGGPVTATNIIRVIVCRLRKRVGPGYAIVRDPGRRSRGYTLVQKDAA